MSLNEVTEGMYALGNAWEQFKQVNENRLSEIERKGHADPLHDGHLQRINDALDQHKSRMDRMETVHARPGREMKSLGYNGDDQAEYKS
ncbi:MAG: hypothetical protein K2X63_05525, partial [Burkholderiaceae bacterium]|nr:hypothetical protein [Burkholderiaceae bacterium]